MAALLGCTNPAAVNYNPAATEDNGSCVYLSKVDDVCYSFQDINTEQMVDRSFTLSWSVEAENWVFYHDYIPDFYFSTREQLYTLKNRNIWKHNRGPRGQYYTLIKKPFFIDVVFNSEQEFTMNSTQWLTEVIDALGDIEELTTFSHVTIWNSYQCTGKIPLSEYLALSLTGTRKTTSEFSFNEFRDILTVRGGNFLQDLFSDYRVIPGRTSSNVPWYEKRLIEDKYCVVRFEFENTADKSLSLHAVDINANQSIR